MKSYSKKRALKFRRPTRKVKSKFTRRMKGGELIIKPTDLNNTHVCGQKVGDETTGNEIYTAVNQPFQLNETSLQTFFNDFRKSDGNWFKFAIFNNDNAEYIYVMKGDPVNKHSILLIYGLLDVSKPTEYVELREAFSNLIKVKESISLNEEHIEENATVKEFNDEVIRSIPCMPVIAAGSGTVNDDNSVCLNTKSGHYKPTLEIMKIAKGLFERITGGIVTIQEKVSKDELEKKYGSSFKKYIGICL